MTNTAIILVLLFIVAAIGALAAFAFPGRAPGIVIGFLTLLIASENLISYFFGLTMHVPYMGRLLNSEENKKNRKTAILINPIYWAVGFAFIFLAPARDAA